MTTRATSDGAWARVPRSPRLVRSLHARSASVWRRCAAVIRRAAWVFIPVVTSYGAALLASHHGAPTQGALAGLGVLVGATAVLGVERGGQLFLTWSGLTGYLWAFPGLTRDETVARIRSRFAESTGLSDDEVLDAVAVSIARTSDLLPRSRWLPVADSPLALRLERELFKATRSTIARTGLGLAVGIITASAAASGLGLVVSPLAAMAVLMGLIACAASTRSALDEVGLLRARLELIDNPRLRHSPRATS